MAPVRRYILIASLALALVVSCVAIARREPPVFPISDLAVAESYTILAGQAQLWWGPYSRYSWHHPGPLYFYLLWPFYAASGNNNAGLSAGAVVLNIAAMAIAVWVPWRAGWRALAVAAAAACALLSWRFPDATISYWNPHAIVFPFVALAMASAATLGGWLSLLPLVALLASIVAQTHVAIVPAAIVAGVLALTRCLWALREGWNSASGRRAVRSLSIAFMVLVGAWAIPVAEQVREPTGNLTLLWRYFSAPPARTGRPPRRRPLDAWAGALAGSVRPEFATAHGAVVPPRANPIGRGVSLAIVVGLAISLALARRATSGIHAAVPLLLLAVAFVALWSVSRITTDVFDHAVFWIAGVGAASLAAIAAALTTKLTSGSVDGRWDRYSGFAAAALLVACGGWAIVQLNAASMGQSAETPTAVATRELAAAVAALAAQPGHKPIIRVDQAAWEIAAGVVLQLQRASIPVAVERDWLDMFTPALGPTGDETAVLTIAAPATTNTLKDLPGSSVIATSGSFAAILTRP